MTSPVNPSGQQTDLRKVFYQCRLGKSDLERMFSMACEGIPLPEVKVSTIVGNTRFWKTTLPDLVVAVRNGAPELNADWTNLSLEAVTPSQERGVQITIDRDRTEVNVSGSDTTWAFGQIARIENFLVSRGAVSSSPRYENMIMLISIMFLLILGAFLLVNGVDDQSVAECVRQAKAAHRNDVIFNISMPVLFSFGLLFPFYQILKRRALRAQLKVDAEVSIGSWWSRLSAGDRIAAVGIPLTLLATVAAIISTANDVWGK
ncbi:hypothetical protein ACIOTI_07825 [Streptomyces sp. NPDC087843]|uniref:hypothetical protein n=1 Tax=Streptomyces sp. NPDC087843 TaxID=3365804 RepID=UPI0038292ABE